MPSPTTLYVVSGKSYLYAQTVEVGDHRGSGGDRMVTIQKLACIYGLTDGAVAQRDLTVVGRCATSRAIVRQWGSIAVTVIVEGIGACAGTGDLYV